MKVLTEITSFIGNGVTKPVIATINSEYVVAKSIKNDESYPSLFNEILGYKLAHKLNVPCPDYGIAYFKSNITINNITRDVSFADNEFFTYTKFENGVIPIETPGMLNRVSKEDILEIIIFDIFICNTDRNKGNLLIKMPKKAQPAKLFPIDYTHIFPGECIWPDVLRQGLYTEKELVTNVLSTGNYQLLIENKTFTVEEINSKASEMKYMINTLNIDDIISRVPEELLNNFSVDELNLLKVFLKRNQENFSIIIKELVNYLVR